MARKISKTEIKKIKEKLLKDRIEIVKRVEELKRNDPFQDPDHA